MSAHVQRLVGIVPAAVRAERMMQQAETLSELAIDAAISGRETDANVLSAEAARRRKEAADLMAPYLQQDKAILAKDGA